MKSTYTQISALAALATALCAAQSASAQSVWNAQVNSAANTNWSTAANWTPNGVPGAATAVTFNDGTEVFDPFTINNVVDGGSFGGAIASLTYAHTNNATYQNTLIGSGQTLNVTGSLTVGIGTALTTAASPVTTIAGTGGRLNINNASANLNVTLAEPSTSGAETLDMSGLDTFTFTGARLMVGVAGAARSTGTLLLARTNIITLSGSSPQVDIGDNGGNNGPGSALNLGQTNAIFADNIAMGRSKQNSNGGGLLRFNAALTGNNPAAYFRGHDGVSPVSSWAIADGGSGGGTITDSGTSDFSLGTVNAVVSSMWLARNSTGASAGTSQNNATFTLGAGSFSVGNLTNAMLASSKQNPTVNGTINLNGPGTLTVTTNLVLAALNGFTGTANSTVNVNGGTLAVNSIVAGGGNSTLNVNNAALLLTNSAGTSSQPLTALSLSSATLQLSVSGGAAIYATSVTADGNSTDTNLINIAQLPTVTSYPTSLPLIQAFGPIGLIGGTFNFALGSLPGTYQGYLSNGVANSSIDLVITGSSLRADVWDGNLNGNWDTTTANWKFSSQHVAYQQGDLVTFDDTLSGTPNVVLATTLAPGAVTFNNSTHNYVLSGANKITGLTGLSKQGSGTVTLSETGGDDFSGGIVVSGGTLVLDNPASSISGGLVVNSGTVQIGNNDANGGLPSGGVTLNDSSTLVFKRTDLVTVGTALAGSGAVTQNGSGTLMLTAANGYTGNTTVSQGTLGLSGAGSIGSSAALAVNNATFDASGVAAVVSLNDVSLANATVTVGLNGNPAARVTCANLALGGGANHLNISSISPISSYPVTFTVIQSTNPVSGTFNMTLGTLPAASPAYAGNVSLSADQTSVLLTLTAGPTSFPAVVSWVGSDAPNLNWSDRLNWQLPAVPGAGDNAIFSGVDTQASSAVMTPGGGPSAFYSGYVNNTVDGNFTLASLTYTNANGAYHNTFINDGASLTLTNSLTVGSTTVDFGSGATEGVSISGPNASLQVNNTNSTLYFGLGSPNSGGHQVTLDMSALGTFNASVSRMFLGVGSSSGGINLGRESAAVYLAQTNTIVAAVSVSGTETSDTSATAVAFDVGDNDGNGGNTCYLYLGQTNAIFADAIVTARQKQNAQMLFNPALTTLGRPSAYFRGRNGGTISTWGVADGVANTGTVSPNGVNDFTGGLVDARVGTMYVGRAANSSTGTGTANGTLTFDGGLIDVTTLYVGYQPAAITKTANGTLNVNSNSVAGSGATLRVRSALNLAVSPNSTATGALNLNNGVVQLSSATFGLNSTITLTGGILILTNPAGSVVAPLGTFNLGSQGTPDNSATLLSLPVRTNSPALTVTTLNIDGLSYTTNVINIESVGPVGATPVQLPLIQYTSRSLTGGTFNVGLGTLPSGYAGYLVDDTANSQIALVLTNAIHPQPVITSSTLQGANLVLSGVNGFANVPFTVISSTDLAQPTANWTQAAAGLFGPDGSFTITVPVSGSSAQQFFRLRVQ